MCKRVERICQVDPEGWYAPIVGEELVRCKECKHFELDHFDMWDGVPIITGHEICTKWGGGCKTSLEGFCFMGEKNEKRTDD